MRKFCFAAFAAVLIGTTACTPKAPEQFTGKIVEIIEMDGKPALKIDAVVLTKKDLI